MMMMATRMTMVLVVLQLLHSATHYVCLRLVCTLLLNTRLVLGNMPIPLNHHTPDLQQPLPLLVSWASAEQSPESGQMLFMLGTRPRRDQGDAATAAVL